MKTIPLSQGKVALVDDADYEAVSQFKWYAAKGGRGLFYARRNTRNPDGTRGYQFLHQFLMPGVGRVDHLDGNSLNDQMENLRSATHRQNMQGFRRKAVGASSRFRCVFWHKRLKKWQVQIQVNGKQIHLGSFEDEFDAARAFDVAARKYRGESAQLNFP